MANPNLPAAGSGTITLNEADPSFGDLVTFTVTGVEKLKNPRLNLRAYQDGVLVYGQGEGQGYEHPHGNNPVNFGTYQLGSPGGAGSDWDSGEADCTAEVGYWTNEHGNEWTGPGSQTGFVIVASTSFHAAA